MASYSEGTKDKPRPGSFSVDQEILKQEEAYYSHVCYSQYERGLPVSLRILNVPVLEFQI